MIAKNEKTNKIDKIECTISLNGQTPSYYGVASEAKPLGEMIRLDDEDETVSVEIKYTNYVVAKGLAAVVLDWYNSLPDGKVLLLSKTFEMLYLSDRYDRFPVFSFGRGAVSILALLLAVGITKHTDWLIAQTTSKVSFAIFVSFTLVFAMNLLFSWIVSFGHKIDVPSKFPLLLINAGDEKRIAKYEAATNKWREREATVNKIFIYGFVVSLCAGILVNFL